MAGRDLVANAALIAGAAQPTFAGLEVVSRSLSASLLVCGGQA